MLLFTPHFNSEGKYKKITFWEKPDPDLLKTLLESFQEHNKKIEEEWSREYGGESIQWEIEIQYCFEEPDKELIKEER